ncbi:hypothetical protein GGR57DRAFT_446480 [Xylariaceae sp. FL1272]|nr:hypothetical protein GGR57DRAFT_446480 [Xylariaceae sp. FL1272]
MEDRKGELLQHARDFATSTDLYELLSVTPEATQPEVHRAWRKASLKHHPDKAKDFNPELWQIFERARDVLSSPEARAVYDGARAAAVQAQKARATLDAKRREMIEDLEARERGVKRKASNEENSGRHMMTEAEKKVLLEKGNRRIADRKRLIAEAEARERERELKRQAEEASDSHLAGEEPLEHPSPQPETDSAHTQPEASANETDPTHPTDDYDARIANIERRLKQRKAERKARKKAEKKAKNSRWGEDETLEPTSSHATSNGNTTQPTTTTPTPQSAPIQDPSSTPVPVKNGGFASTMAKLRAAQREKERKRAEAEAEAAAAATNTETRNSSPSTK